MTNFNPNTHYKVKEGDTGFGIAESHGLTLDVLKALNPDKNLDAIAVAIKQTPYLNVVNKLHLSWANTQNKGELRPN